MNVAILRGRLSSPPREQRLASGDRLVSLEVTTRAEQGPADSVPVAWFPRSAPPAWEAGQEVVVIGRVRRRFFRAGGATSSRTEVVATNVVPATRRSAIKKAVDAAVNATWAGLEP